ncbi:MAG: Serine/threonine-protein kinase PknD [Phycisphaerae bacterium]|nr:Serine/threonine-protein kinase PknD [Phycisphaerae bacterium]
MNDPRVHARAKPILADALDLSADAREAYVIQACGSDVALLEEVRSLLKFADRDDSRLGDAVLDRGRDRMAALFTPNTVTRVGSGVVPGASVSVDAPLRVGGYRVQRVIGAGGMGRVFEAVQENPRRRIALKLIRTFQDAPALLRRFEYEAQTLGRLEHPGIARIYEAGSGEVVLSETPRVVAGSPQPFIAMEYIEGEPLDVYVRRAAHSIPQRLRIIEQLCLAVGHAHTKGVIHRDLKPGNILVTPDGTPKVLDFGIARAADAEDGHTLTHTGHPLGTPAYMSPEQIEGSSDIDTRTDVYALGVILFELLTGVTPLQARSGKNPSVPEIRKWMAEANPPKPSSLFTGGDAPLRAGERGAVSGRTGRATIESDLDWIVLKALEKDRDRRYPSADALREDLLRYLRHEPIQARPPELSYQLRKFARRHRAIAAVVAASATLLIVSSIVVGALYLRTQSALAAEEKQRRIADREARVSGAIAAFLKEDLLAAADPNQLGRDVTVAEALEVASLKVSDRFGDDPDVEGPLRATLGSTYYALGKLDESLRELQFAVPLLERAYGPAHDRTLHALRELAFVHRARGELDVAEGLFRQAIQRCRQNAPEPTRMSLGIEDNLARVYRDAGRFDEAETLSTRVLEDRRRILGESDPDTMASLNNLAYLYQSLGRFEEAVPMARQALDLFSAAKGEEDSATLAVMSNLAWLLTGLKQYAEAEPLHRRALDIKTRVLGPDHGDTVSGMHGLAECFRQQERFAEAAEILALAEPAAHRAWPADSWMISSVQAMYGDVLIQLERYDEAEPILLDAFGRLERTVGADHQLAQMTLDGLIGLYERTDRPDQAATWREKLKP